MTQSLEMGESGFSGTTLRGGPTLGLFCCFGSCRAGASPTPAPLWLLVDWVLWWCRPSRAPGLWWFWLMLTSLGGEQGPLACLPALPDPHHTASGVWGWGPTAQDACLHGNPCQGSILTLNSLLQLATTYCLWTPPATGFFPSSLDSSWAGGVRTLLLQGLGPWSGGKGRGAGWCWALLNLAADGLVSQCAGGGVDPPPVCLGGETLGPGVNAQDTAGFPGPRCCWRCSPRTSATPLLRSSGAEGVLTQLPVPLEDCRRPEPRS